MKYEENRPWRKLYSTKRWKVARLYQLSLNPLCKMCLEQGKTTAATIVDHIIPHKGDEELFFDEENHQSLCKQHHDSSKQKAEKRGVSDIGCDENGIPIDANHHWHI